MAEILLFSADMGTAATAPKAGDVLSVHPDGWQWGECELGGPTWTKSIYTRTVQQIVLGVHKSINVGGIQSGGQLAGLNAAGQLTRISTGVAQSITDAQAMTPGVPQIVSTNALTNTVTVNLYSRQYTGSVVTPISQHPNGVHPFWRILKLPNIAVADLANMVVGLQPAPTTPPGPTYAFPRATFVDRSKITDTALAAYWDDATRAAPFFTSQMALADFTALTTARTA